MDDKIFSSKLEELLKKDGFVEDLELEKDASNSKIYTRENERIQIVQSNKKVNIAYYVNDYKIVELIIENWKKKPRKTLKSEDTEDYLEYEVYLYSSITKAQVEMEKDYKE